jgi:hypothetical protein
MKIFLSWSGERSRHVATALRDWLPMLLQNTEPWLSDRDIAAGDRWSLEVGKKLEECQFGIICLTRENTEAPWVLFEAGALSKTLVTSAVCPYLYDVELQEIAGPLSQFQAKKADRASTLELVGAINQKAASPLPQQRLDELYDVLWAKLETKLAAVPQTTQPTPKLRSQPEVLEELVGSVRRLELRVSRIGRVGSLDQKFNVRLSSDEISVDTEWTIEVDSPGEVLSRAAKILGLDPDGFGSDWHFADPGSHERVSSREELRRRFEGAPRVLFLQHTTLPF